MWKWLKKKSLPWTRNVLLEIIPKVELVPVVVPEKYEIPRDFEPPDPKTIAVKGAETKRTKAAERAASFDKVKSSPKKTGKKSGKVSPEAKAMVDKYESNLNALDEEEVSNIIKNA